MNAWHVLEAFAAYAFLAVVFSALVLAVWINKYGDIPLLDGTPLQSALDDRDRARHIAQAQAASDAYLTSERLSMELDYVWSLPAREHPPMGWTS